jgi:CheY-like chemotaxis protein
MEPTMEAARPPARGKTLLIVEDDILPAMALRDELEDAGYHVLDLTGRHQEALTAATAHKPDFALVNIELQGRDDGIELARELKAMHIPVLFISGQVNKARTAQTVAVGSLPKPYSPTDMVDAVAYLLQKLEGGVGLPRPAQLEVFDDAAADLAKDPA